MTPGSATLENLDRLIEQVKDPYLLIEATCDMADHVAQSIRQARGDFLPFPEAEKILGVTRSWLRGEIAVGAAWGEATSHTYKNLDTADRRAEMAHYKAASQLTRMLEAVVNGQQYQAQRLVRHAAADCRRAIIQTRHNIRVRRDEDEWQIAYMEALCRLRSSSIPEGRLRNSLLANRQ